MDLSAALIKRTEHYWRHGAAWVLGPLCVGLVAMAFAWGSQQVSIWCSRAYAALPLAPLLALPACFALCAWLTRRYFPGAQGSGIPQTIAALDSPPGHANSHLLSLRIAAGKILMTLIGLAGGASIGREGPTVQVGAAIMHAFHVRGEGLRRKLIFAGGAAGIAAAFNTPLAGIMFAVEELSKKHVFNANSSVLMTVVVSGLIPLSVLGNYTYFGSSDVYLDWESGMRAILVCGAVGGVAGGLFSRIMRTSSAFLPRWAATAAKDRPIVFAALCGLGVALLGYASHGMVFGTGYEATRLTLEDRSLLPWYFGPAKLLATALSSISGIPGGIFAPSLAVGAGFGEDVAVLLPNLAPHGATILLAMAAYLTGVTRAPVTSFIIMMEMTGSQRMLIPLMAATLIANGVSKLISRPPLYHALAERFSH